MNESKREGMVAKLLLASTIPAQMELLNYFHETGLWLYQAFLDLQLLLFNKGKPFWLFDQTKNLLKETN